MAGSFVRHTSYSLKVTASEVLSIIQYERQEGTVITSGKAFQCPNKNLNTNCPLQQGQIFWYAILSVSLHFVGK